MNPTPSLPEMDVAPSRAYRFGSWLIWGAFALLMGCIVVRPFLMEMPYRGSILQGIQAAVDAKANDLPCPVTDRSEFSRACFSLGIGWAAILWFLGAAFQKFRKIAGLSVWALLILFSFFVSISGFFYTSALAVAEQFSLILAGWLMWQLCYDARRRTLVLIILTGLAGAMVAKAAWQMGFEGPHRIADFEANRVERLMTFGWQPGTPQAQMIESRVRDTSPYGFFGLTNLFASLMVLLGGAAIALAGDKLAAARKRWNETRKDRSKGEIDLGLFMAVLTALVAVAAIGVIPFTRSRGAVGGVIIAAMAALIAWVFRKKLTGRWGRSAIIVGLLAAVLAASVIGYGLKYDRLPTKTMTFRWYYWTASAEIVKDHPLWGVGAGNFPEYYLKYRRPVAEEEVKAPHNVILHALVQYGLPGGTVYMVLVFGAMLLSTRPILPPAAASEKHSQAPPWKFAWTAGWVLFWGIAIALLKIYFGGLNQEALIVFDAVLPAIAFIMFALLGGACAQSLFDSGLPGPVSRYAVPAALAAFLLHNMITFDFWMPGVAIFFWVLAGWCLSQRLRRRKGNKFIFLVMSVLLLGLIVRSYLFRLSMSFSAYGKMNAEQRVLQDIYDGQFDRIVQHCDLLSERWLRDPLAAADAARTAAWCSLNTPQEALRKEWMEQACKYVSIWTRLGIRKGNPVQLYARYMKQAREMGSEIYSALEVADAMGKAVALNPADARPRIDYAEMLIDAESPDEALKQLDKAEWLESQLNSESIERFRPEEKWQILALRDRAKEMQAAASRPAASQAAD